MRPFRRRLMYGKLWCFLNGNYKNGGGGDDDGLRVE